MAGWQFPQITEMKKLDAQVVYEREEAGSVHLGPASHERVGVRFGARVFWLGSRYMPNGQWGEQFNLDTAFATELARRWNATP